MHKLIVAALLVTVPASGCVAAGVTTLAIGAGVTTLGVAGMPDHCHSQGCIWSGILSGLLVLLGGVTMLTGGIVTAVEL